MNKITFSVSFGLEGFNSGSIVSKNDDVIRLFNEFKENVGEFASGFGVEVNSFGSVDQAFECTVCGEVKGRDQFFWRVRKGTGKVDRVGSKCRVCTSRMNSLARKVRKTITD